MGTGLPHSILAWVQDCHTQSWRGHRIAQCFPENAGSAVLYSTTPPDSPPGLRGKHRQCVGTQRCTPGLAARIARKTPSAFCCVILLPAQDCFTQSCCGNRIAPVHYEQLGLGTVLARVGSGTSLTLTTKGRPLGCVSNRLVTGIGLTCYACKASDELVKHQTGLWKHQTGLRKHQTGLFEHWTGLCLASARQIKTRLP